MLIAALFVAVVVVAVVVAGVWPTLRRRIEDMGWMEPRPPKDARRPIGTVTAHALAQFEVLFNPAMEHVIEFEREAGLTEIRLDEPAD